MRAEAFQQIDQKMPFAASPALYRVVVEPEAFPPEPR